MLELLPYCCQVLFSSPLALADVALNPVLRKSELATQPHGEGKLAGLAVKPVVRDTEPLPGLLHGQEAIPFRRALGLAVRAGGRA
jgi:hypothetical protein